MAIPERPFVEVTVEVPDLTHTHTHTLAVTALSSGTNHGRRLAPAAYCLATANKKPRAWKRVSQLEGWEEKVLRI